jgi:hypothetical protein
MTTKEYFSQTLTLNKRIKSKLDHLAVIRELVSKATATMSDMPPCESRDVHKMEEAICRMVDLEKEVDADVERLVNLRLEQVRIISEIEKPLYQLILEQRYLCCHSWDYISEELEYDQRYLLRLNNEALAAAEELMQKRNFGNAPNDTK